VDRGTPDKAAVRSAGYAPGCAIVQRYSTSTPGGL
jgi:hypothetical protein